MLNAVLALNELDTNVFHSPSPGAAPLIYDSHVAVPDAHLLFNGEFKRVGTNDLKIVGEDGQSFFIQDYFASDTRAHLMSPQGATLSASVVEALAGPLAPGQHAQAGGQAASTQPVIGRVDALSGSATVVRNGVTVSLNIGDNVRKGDVVQTSGGSAVAIVFADGTTFSLNANARMVLDDFVYAAGGTGNSAMISLVQGTFSFVAGQVAKTGDMRVETPVATMGIRGTAVLIEISANDGQTRFSVMVEPDGTTGAFNLYNKTTGALIGTVNNSQVGWVVTPAGPLQVVAQQVQKTPGELAQELGIVQQIFTIFNNNQQNPFVPTQDRGDNPNDPNPQTAGGVGSGGALDTTGNAFADLINTVSNNGSLPPIGFNVPLPGLPLADPNAPPPIFNVTVTPNQPPVAVDDPDGTPGGGDVTPDDDPDDDTDPEGGNIVVRSVQHIDPVQGVPSGPVVQIPQNDVDGETIEGTYGTLTIHADGTYTFVPHGAAFDALAEGAPETDLFQYTISDPVGATASAILTINLAGVNDAPEITGGQTSGSVDQIPSGFASGVLTKTDIDSDDSADNDVWSVVAETGSGQSQDGTTSVKGIYGTLSVDADGKWTYTLNDSNATKALTPDDHPTETFEVVVTDSHGASATQTIVITVNGENDAPTGTDDDDSVQAAGLVNGNPTLGDPFAGGNVLEDDVDPDAGDSVSVVGVSTGAKAGTLLFGAYVLQGTYGLLVLKPDGAYVYTLNNFDPDTIALGDGETGIETFTYTIADGSGAQSSASLTIDVAGANSAPIILSGNSSGSITEDSAAISKTLTKIDVDGDDTLNNDIWTLDLRQGQTRVDVNEVKGTYGTLTIDDDGKWTYTLDNSLTATQALGTNDHRNETFTVRVTDSHGASDTQTVRVTVNGKNDDPVAGHDTFQNIPLGWELGPDNHLYKYVSASQVTWQQAAAAALAAGGYLATITSETENDFVFDYLVGNKIAWLGGTDSNQEGTWTWVTGESFAYAPWAGGEPNDNGDFLLGLLSGEWGEDYLVTWGNQSWNDLDNSLSDRRSVHGYVIERNGTPGANYLQITEDAPANIQTAWILANDTDIDNDVLNVGLASGVAANFGASHLGATIQLNGSNFVYNASGSAALQALGAGQIAEDYFYYQIDDGHGGTSIAKVTLTVNGLNDAPHDLSFHAGNALQSAEGGFGLGGSRTLGQAVATDPDTTDTLTYSLGSGSSTGFTLSGGGTLKTGLLGLGSGTYNLNLVATDQSGASTTEQLTVWVGNNGGLFSSGSETKSFAGHSNDVIAFGRGGNDNVTGSAHNDTLIGGAGNDKLIGGSGGDTFVFKPGDGQDTILDFNTSQHDLIDLSAFADIHDFDDLHFTTGSNTEIIFDGGQKIVVQNVTLSLHDFIFHA